MNIDNVLVKTHFAALEKKLSEIDSYILMGPSSDINADEVSMEYMRRVGKREAILELKELFEINVKSFFNGDPT